MNDTPILCLPTTIVLLDDNEQFSMDLSVALSDKYPLIKTFSNQNEVLEFIRKFGISSPFSKTWNTQNDSENVGEEISDVSLFWEWKVFSIHKKVYDPNRFAAVSVLIVDYQMSGMDGLEVCKAINNPFVQKILLTGVADAEVGIDALNRGWIHQYVSKHDPKMLEKIIEGIESAQNRCFQELTNSILLGLLSPEEGSCLSDPAFKNLLQRCKEKTQATEYYPCDRTGSIMFVNGKGEIASLCVSTKDQLDLNYELAYPEIRNAGLREDLKRYEKMICCFKPEGFITTDNTSIEEYVYQAHKLEGERPYYYAFESSLFDVDRSSIQSYNAFLDRNG